MKAYSVTSGPKQETRSLFADTVAKFVPAPTNILLMPGEEAHDAKLLKARFPRAKIKGLDNSEEKAEHIASTHWQCIDDIYAGSVGGYAWHSKHRDDPDNPDRGIDVFPRMDAIWLDHTGGCTEKNIKDLIQVVHYAAKDKCVFAATFTSNPRMGTESADRVLRQNSWIDPEEFYDPKRRAWADAQQARAILNTPDKVANAVRTALEKGYIESHNLEHGAHEPWERVSYRRLEVLDSVAYRARQGSTKMFFFILYIERL